MSTMNPTARLRIDFAVREILPDGHADDEVRFVKFSQEIDVSDIREFFENKGQAVGILFANLEVGTQSISFKAAPRVPIKAIMALRRLTGLSLKDAKDKVDDWNIGPALFVHNSNDLEACFEAFSLQGIPKDFFVVKKVSETEILASSIPQYMRPKVMV